MRLGLGSYTYTWAVGVPGQEPAQPLTAPDLVRRAAAAGVGCVQIADNLPLDALGDGERRDLRTLAAEMAVAIEVGARGLTAERLERFLDLAVFFHSPILRFVIDGPGHEPTIDDVVGVVSAALPRLRETGVRLAIENHDRLKATEFRDDRPADRPRVGGHLPRLGELDGSGRGRRARSWRTSRPTR